MSKDSETVEDRAGPAATVPAQPGVIVVFTAGTPVLQPVPAGDGGRVELGRGGFAGLPDDETMSREHAVVTALAEGGGWRVRDLDSRNGTFLDGQRVTGEVHVAARAVLRVGHTVLLLEPDVGPLHGPPPEAGADGLIGPRLREVLARVALARAGADPLLIIGESGTGKELVARAFHGGRGPFVAVNCAAIPVTVAERLLFGAVRGAFSGASHDAPGYLQAADGGTLFLDEIGELDPQVQAKLLRVIESHEVTALGATVPTPVAVRVCAATHRDLRRDVTAGRFRQDLYFRLAQREVLVPSLRARCEEIPWLLARAVATVHPDLRPDGHLVEACCLRPWPGNLRELLAEARQAGVAALAAGAARVGVSFLRAGAGLRLDVEAPGTEPAANPGPPVGPGELTRAQVEAALADVGGNVAGAARALGLHRNQLRRLLGRYSADDDGRDGA